MLGKVAAEYLVVGKAGDKKTTHRLQRMPPK